jgi:glycosyltransferase involved in cell wall biosynthesis
MKIAFFLSSRNIIPPAKTGGLEQPFYYFIKELVKRGHDITLYAAPGSKINGVKIKYISPFPTFTKQKFLNLQERITSFYDLSALGNFFYTKEADKFDIIQFGNYIFYEILPFSKWTKTPIIVQINYPHDEIYPYIKHGLGKHNNIYYLPVSNFIKSIMPDLQCLQAVYPVPDFSDFSYSEKSNGYLFYIGRICPEKGVDLAVKIAIKSNKKLIIAGGIGESQKEFFRDYIKPYIDNDKIVYVGEVGFKYKLKLYKNALATLFPIRWNEPFGNVLLESMACGTPTIAFDRAAVREIIKNKKNGLIVADGDIQAFVKAVGKIDKLDRNLVRKYTIEHFSIKKEVDKYEKICEQILKDKKN